MHYSYPGQTSDTGPVHSPTSIMGTHDLKLGATILSQTVEAWKQPSNKPGEAVDLGCALFRELQPTNTLESMLLSQLAACHSHCLGMFASASRAVGEDTQAKYLKLSDRLMRTFASSVEALERLRRGGRQSVVVEHVHVNEGGQAIVGNVAGGGLHHG